MKVYKNILDKLCYGRGLLIVAADSLEEAHAVCIDDDSLEFSYWTDYGDERGRFNPIDSDTYYRKSNFREIPNLEWHGEACVIAEENYVE